MAGIIRAQAALQVSHEPFTFQWAQQVTAEQTGRGMNSTVRFLGDPNTPETIDVGELGQTTGPGGIGFVILHNTSTDTSQVIEWGVLDDNEFRLVGRLLPGEFAFFRQYYAGSNDRAVLQARPTSSSGGLLQAYVFCL